MPLVFPIEGAATNTREIVAASLGTLLTGITLAPAPGLATSTIRGLGVEDARAAIQVRVEASRGAVASLDAGLAQASNAPGSLDAGAAREGVGTGTLTVNTLALGGAQLAADVGNSGTDGATERTYGLAPAALSVAISRIAPAPAAIRIRGATTSNALASLSQRQATNLAALSAMAIALHTQSTARASLDAGATSQSVAHGAVEIETAEGIDVIIDIIDEIAGGIRGDIC